MLRPSHRMTVSFADVVAPNKARWNAADDRSTPRLNGRCYLAVMAMMASSAIAAPFIWQTATPESHGLMSAELDRFRDHLVAHKTKIFLLIHDDRIIYEWYGPDYS